MEHKEIFMKKNLLVALGAIVLTVSVVTSIICLWKINNTRTDKNSQAVIVDTRSEDTPETESVASELSGKTISFAGINDTSLKNQGRIKLENLPDNKEFLMTYTITNADTGEEVFKTDMIPAGKCVMWTPSETLDPGEYHFSFLETPYYQAKDGEYIPLTSGNNEVTITLLE